LRRRGGGNEEKRQIFQRFGKNQNEFAITNETSGSDVFRA
jgi:hypothetical protein